MVASSGGVSSRRSPVHHTSPIGTAAPSSASPPTWSAWGWVSTTRSTRRIPRALRKGTRTRSPAPTGPTSTTITWPSGSSTTTPSPCPTGRNVTRRPPASSSTRRASCGPPTRCSAHDATPCAPSSGRSAIAHDATPARISAAVTRRPRRAHAPPTSARPSAPRTATTLPTETSMAACGTAAAPSASTRRPRAPRPAIRISHAPHPGASASITPPRNDSGTMTSEPSGAAGTLASTPTSERRPKCQATTGAVATVAARLARPTTRAWRGSHRSGTRPRAVIRWASQGSITRSPSRAPTESWSAGSTAQLGRQASRTRTAHATPASGSG